MADNASLGVERDRRLDEVLVQYLEAVETGSHPDRADLLARHPDLAAELAAFFADQDEFDSLVAPLRTPGPGSAAGSGSITPHAAPLRRGLTLPCTIGDYELLEEVARGGMGVVYRARQLSLQRTVALKMILKGEFAAPEDVQRFRLEAEAAAGLDHPNIVPIYEVGEHEGQPYFSMKLVEGGNLSQRLGRFVGQPREAARLLVPVARAVHYAHERGILHRDLKPANILLSTPRSGGQDSDLASPRASSDSCPTSVAEAVPHVTDFGLAKRVAGPASPSLTQSGAAVGTPSYMAPEQAVGQRKGLTVAADVYSLGAILYEMLTGAPPFKADTPLQTLFEVMQQEPVPPHLRQAGIDRDLETICLKCLQKEAGKRYASAAALADDLERYLAGETILARPIGRVERLGRWCRRNVALAVAGSLAAVALVAVAGDSCLLALAEAQKADLQAHAAADLREALARTQEHAVEAQQRAAEAEKERGRAEASFRQAHQAVNHCLHVSEELAKLPGAQSVRKNLLATALEYYLTFLKEHGDDPTLRAELADTYVSVGEITSATGSKTRALDAFRRALDLFQELARSQPRDPHWQSELVHTLNDIGVVQGAISQPAAARESLRQALAITERLIHDYPQDRSYLHSLARLHENLANHDRAAGDYERALEHAAQAQTLFEQLLCVKPDSSAAQGNLALSINNQGALYAQLDRLDEACRCFETALSIREKLGAETPRNGPHQLGLAASCRDLGLAYQHLGRSDEAERFLERARDLRAVLARENPGLTLYQSDLAASLNDLGNVRRSRNQLREALDCHQQALAILRQLATLDPNVSSVRSDLALTHYNCGLVLSANRQHGDALRAYQHARDLYVKLIEVDPEKHDCRHHLAAALHQSATTLANLNRPEDGLATLREAVEQERMAMRQAPKLVRYRRALSGHYAALATAAQELGRQAEAGEALQQQQALGADLSR
jgi:serine/threonine-protein kinase